MKKTNKLLALLLVLAMACSIFMTGCGGSDDGEEQGGGDTSTLVIAIQDEIEGTDIQQIGWENVGHSLI